MYPSSACTAGMLALNSWSTASRMPGLVVIKARTCSIEASGLSGVASSVSILVHTTGYSCMHEGMRKPASGTRFRRRCLSDDSFSLDLNGVLPDQARDLE